MATKTATGTGKITLWGIEVFVAAADELSITAAARRLGASPSAVSQQLTNLESALGTSLLNRNERPMSLTRAGALFRRRAQTVLNVAARARAELAMQDPSTLTVLRLGMIEDFEADLTPRLLQDMAQDLANCQFVLETGPSHRLLDKLDQRALDMVVGAEMEGRGDGYEVHPILTDPFMAVVPAGTQLGGDPLEALRAMPLILYTERHHMGRLIAAHLARLNLTLSHRFELDSYNAIMAMVAAGAGWTILTPLGFLHARRFHDQVAAVPLPFEAFNRRISLTARRGVLEEFPALTAARLRPLVEALVVEPMLRDHPWMRPDLRMNGGG